MKENNLIHQSLKQTQKIYSTFCKIKLIKLKASMKSAITIFKKIKDKFSSKK